jgi:hypothetical protein
VIDERFERWGGLATCRPTRIPARARKTDLMLLGLLLEVGLCFMIGGLHTIDQ